MKESLIKKIASYLSVLASIVFFTSLIVCLFNLKTIYHVLVVPNEERLPESWRQMIKKITHQDLEEKIIYKPEKTIQILEGWNEREVSQYFEREGLWQSEELLELAGFPKYDYRQKNSANEK
ncbi:MAG: hypothetical protein NTX66_02515 [Candidatus Falkowbacteria bacterium]|nr:hypothetical protein [Candidatus Falkowbacteria bacterium]